MPTKYPKRKCFYCGRRVAVTSASAKQTRLRIHNLPPRRVNVFGRARPYVYHDGRCPNAGGRVNL